MRFVGFFHWEFASPTLVFAVVFRKHLLQQRCCYSKATIVAIRRAMSSFGIFLALKLLNTKFDVYCSQFTQFMAKIYLFHLCLLLSKRHGLKYKLVVVQQYSAHWLKDVCGSGSVYVLLSVCVCCFYCCVDFALFSSTTNSSWCQILWSTFIWFSSLFCHIWISYFEFTICTFQS